MMNYGNSMYSKMNGDQGQMGSNQAAPEGGSVLPKSSMSSGSGINWMDILKQTMGGGALGFAAEADPMAGLLAQYLRQFYNKPKDAYQSNSSGSTPFTQGSYQNRGSYQDDMG